MKWNYRERYVDIFMPTYASKKLTEYDYKPTNHLQYCQYEPNSIIYGNNLDSIVHEIKSPLLDKNKKKYVQQVLSRFLNYAYVIDMTIFHAFSTIASEHANPTERALKGVHQSLHYTHTNTTAVIPFRASDMILNVHSNASYTSTRK